MATKNEYAPSSLVLQLYQELPEGEHKVKKAYKKGGGTASGEATAHVAMKILGVAPLDDEHDHFIGVNDKKDIITFGFFHKDNGSTPVAYTSLRPLEKIKDTTFVEVVGMHVHPDYRGKGYGKRLWNHVADKQPNLHFVVKPDAFKDRAKSTKELGQVYKSYGFLPIAETGYYERLRKHTTHGVKTAAMKTAVVTRVRKQLRRATQLLANGESAFHGTTAEGATNIVRSGAIQPGVNNAKSRMGGSPEAYYGRGLPPWPWMRHGGSGVAVPTARVLEHPEARNMPGAAWSAGIAAMPSHGQAADWMASPASLAVQPKDYLIAGRELPSTVVDEAARSRHMRVIPSDVFHKATLDVFPLAKNASLMKTVDFQGMKIRLDRPKGFVQTGKSKTGKPWARTYLFDYGFIPRTKGGDGDGVDVFIGPDKNDQESYWAIQKKDDGSFDEYKVFLGFGSKAAAKKAYTDHIPAKYLKGMVTIRTNMMKAMLGLEPVEKFASIVASLGAMEMAKEAVAERLARLAATPVEQLAPSVFKSPTPQLFMRSRSPQQLRDLQNMLEAKWGQHVTNPIMQRAEPMLHKLPVGKWQTIARKGTELFAEDPVGTVVANLVPVPGAHPAYVLGKKGLEKTIDRFFPLPGVDK